jgi:hypothetical protein
MAAQGDDLQQALQENLRLRSELAANVAKAKGSGSKQVSRGFHRLGVVLALLTLLGFPFLAPDNLAPPGFVIAVYALISLLVYGIVRAVGWVIGGFAAS